MLAFRPALPQKLTIGVLRNLTASATGLYNEFGEKEMTKAYTKLITIDKNSIMNLIWFKSLIIFIG